MPTAKWRKEHVEQMRSYRRKHYSLNKQKYKDNVQARRRELSKWLQELKRSYSCIKCGENHPACLDFHHRDSSSKEFAISQNRQRSRENILKEIAKCDVLCANCHRKEHYES